MQTVVVVVDVFIVFSLFFFCGQVDLRLMQTYADCCQVRQKNSELCPGLIPLFQIGQR